MSKPKPKYRYFDGIEFYTDGVIWKTRKEAEECVEWWKKIVDPPFPFRYRIVKTKLGYVVYTNNTVSNMNYWEKHGKLPKKK